jgi:hypothetical protein
MKITPFIPLTLRGISKERFFAPDKSGLAMTPSFCHCEEPSSFVIAKLAKPAEAISS